MNLIVTSCGKKSADKAEEIKTQQTPESSTGNVSADSDSKTEEKIETNPFDFSTIAERNAAIGEFPYLKEISGFKVSNNFKEKDFDWVVVYDGKTFSRMLSGVKV